MCGFLIDRNFRFYLYFSYRVSSHTVYQTCLLGCDLQTALEGYGVKRVNILPHYYDHRWSIVTPLLRFSISYTSRVSTGSCTIRKSFTMVGTLRTGNFVRSVANSKRLSFLLSHCVQLGCQCFHSFF